MLEHKTILVVGGDLRLITLAQLLQKSNTVYCIGLEQSGCTTISHTTLESFILADVNLDYIILPLPTSLDNSTINAPFGADTIMIEDILSLANCKTAIFGGKLTPSIKQQIENRKLWYIDYLDREELSVLNAIPTAEGAIQIAMEETAITIFESKCLIVGYGRLAKALAPRLAALGADITISARKYSDLAWIKEKGMKAVSNNALMNVVSNKHLIFNTVPATILDRDILSNVSEDCLLIDLASKPGGIDFDVAKQLGLKTIWALSLPGKVAPITAGKIIYDTILNIVQERSRYFD